MTEPRVGERTSHLRAVDRRVAGVDVEQVRANMFSDNPVQETRRVVLALTKSDEIEATVEWLAERYADEPSLSIEDCGTFYRIDCLEGFEIDADEIGELLGRPFTVYDLLVNVSTTIGRAYVDGNVFAITTDLLGWERDVPR